MQFFTGWHQPRNGPSGCQLFSHSFISATRLCYWDKGKFRGFRKSHFPVRDWILDSGAFKELELFGEHRLSVSQYAELIGQFQNCGNLLAVFPQDYMCESYIFRQRERHTGIRFSIQEHQRLTISRFDQLTALVQGVPVLPVLQGFEPSDYVAHIHQYGYRLKPNSWVGVGSVCKRNRNPLEILEVLWAIKECRPDLKLHGFGLKKSALQNPLVQLLLFSADSQAHGLAAGNGQKKFVKSNDPLNALQWSEEIRKSFLSHPRLRTIARELIDRLGPEVFQELLS